MLIIVAIGGMCMRINAINTINSATLKISRANKRTMLQDKPEEVSVNNPSFRGSTGRGIGSVLGFIGGGVLVTAASAVMAIPAIAGVAAVAVATKVCGDAGDKAEENNKKK